jgi:adenylate cyclase
MANDLKNKEAALQMLGPVFEKVGTGLLDHLKIDPDLACIRDDPRFQAMLAAAEKRVASENLPPTHAATARQGKAES